MNLVKSIIEKSVGDQGVSDVLLSKLESDRVLPLFLGEGGGGGGEELSYMNYIG